MERGTDLTRDSTTINFPTCWILIQAWLYSLHLGRVVTVTIIKKNEPYLVSLTHHKEFRDISQLLNNLKLIYYRVGMINLSEVINQHIAKAD